jgi:hypothetical protein
MSKYIQGTRKLGRVKQGADPTLVGRRRLLPSGAIQLERPGKERTGASARLKSER